MKNIAILIIAICMVSCSKDDQIEQSRGTKLISIEYTNDNTSWIEEYTYSSDGELIKIEDFSPSGIRYEIDYQDSKLNEYRTYTRSEGNLISRDSVLYNKNGTIQAIFNFSGNSEGKLSLAWIYEYEYDNENRLSKKSTFFVKIQEYTRVEKYFWNESNIEKVAHYNGDGELRHEVFYEYDDKINYQKNIPKHKTEPINWSGNNVIKMGFKDYSGLLDLSCGPCITEYKYNLDNYPVFIKFNSGREMKLTYE